VAGGGESPPPVSPSRAGAEGGMADQEGNVTMLATFAERYNYLFTELRDPRSCPAGAPGGTVNIL
jgi:hypothetical protein